MGPLLRKATPGNWTAAALGLTVAVSANLCWSPDCLARGSRTHTKHLHKERPVEPVKSHKGPQAVSPLQPGNTKGKPVGQQVFYRPGPGGDMLSRDIKKLIVDVQANQSTSVDGGKRRTLHSQVRTDEQKGLLMALELYMLAHRIKAASMPILQAVKVAGNGSDKDGFSDAIQTYKEASVVIKSAQDQLDYARAQYSTQIDDARSNGSEWVNPYAKAGPRIDIAHAVDMVQGAIDQMSTDLSSLQGKWNRTGSLVSGYVGNSNR